MSTREAKTMSMQELFSEDTHGMVLRITGRSVDDWEAKVRGRLINDVSRGRVDPSSFFPLSELNPLCKKYGFMDDDLIFCRVDSEIVERYNPGYVAPQASFNGGRTTVKTVIAVRLCPNKYSELMGLYGKVIERR